MYEYIAGLLQGITEFLPVSSSGHLVILSSLNESLDLDTYDIAFLHVGIPSSSEKYIASVFFIPRYIPVNKVTPDLDTPGIRANAWARPTIKDWLNEISWKFMSVSFFILFENNKIIENIR